ncbi:MAG: SCO family protein [Bacteroidota bacterium]
MKRIIILLIIAIVGIIVSYNYLKPSEKHQLKIINPIDLNPEMVDSLMQRKGYGHKIGNFSFLNQEGKTISLKDVKGKIFVAEYFFTTCGTICPKMNMQMQRVQKAFIENKDVSILSFTVNPEVDSVSQMKMYADAHGAIPTKWHFLTGEKSKLYELARKSFFVLKPAEAQNLGDAGSDFIHTNNFVLVDKQQRIRGYYDGTNEKEVTHLIEDINQLANE